VVPDEESHQDVRIEPDHQRDSCSTGTAFWPFLRRLPARLMTLLFLTRSSTVPSGIIVKVIRSPAFMRSRSRMSFGMVVWPLLVSVDSVLTVASRFSLLHAV